MGNGHLESKRQGQMKKFHNIFELTIFYLLFAVISIHAQPSPAEESDDKILNRIKALNQQTDISEIDITVGRVQMYKYEEYYNALIPKLIQLIDPGYDGQRKFAEWDNTPKLKGATNAQRVKIDPPNMDYQNRQADIMGWLNLCIGDYYRNYMENKPGITVEDFYNKIRTWGEDNGLSEMQIEHIIKLRKDYFEELKQPPDEVPYEHMEEWLAGLVKEGKMTPEEIQSAQHRIDEMKARQLKQRKEHPTVVKSSQPVSRPETPLPAEQHNNTQDQPEQISTNSSMPVIKSVDSEQISPEPTSDLIFGLTKRNLLSALMIAGGGALLVMTLLYAFWPRQK